MYSKTVKIFLNLIKIYSPPGNETQLRTWVVNYLRSLKISTRIDRVGNVIASKPGYGEPLILCAHLDTVEPSDNTRPIIKNSVIYSDGTTVLGADDKAGVASILGIVTKMCQKKLFHRSLELIFTVQEETDCRGSNHLQYELVRGKEAIILDRSAPVYAITTSAPYIVNVRIECRGKAAHSRSPKDGVHAIKLFCDFCQTLNFGRRNKNVISNIGIVNAGTVANIIPGSLVAVGEIRSTNLNLLQQEQKLWQKKARQIATQYKGRLKLIMEPVMPGFALSRKNHLVQSMSEAICAAGFKPQYAVAWGGSDANILNSHGITAIPLGQGRSGAHSLAESMPIQAFADTEKILLHLLQSPDKNR